MTIEVGSCVSCTDPAKTPFGGGTVARVVERDGSTLMLQCLHSGRRFALEEDKVDQIREDEAVEAEVIEEDSPVAATATSIEPVRADITRLNPDLGTSLAISVEDAVSLVKQFEQFVSEVMREDIDYGKVPGVDKPFLFQSGAQWMLKLMGYYVDLIVDWDHSVEVWPRPEAGEPPFFHYVVKAEARSKRTGQLIGTGLGSCNSHETKYRWRDAKRTCPHCEESTIYQSKFPEQDGSPPGFYCWKKMGGCGEKFRCDDERIIYQKQGRVENPDAADLANTILKMAQKRAEVAAAHRTTIAGRFFTQDPESLEAQGNIDAEWQSPVKETGGGPSDVTERGSSQSPSQAVSSAPPPPPSPSPSKEETFEFAPPPAVQERLQRKAPSYQESPSFVAPTEKQLGLLRTMVKRREIPTRNNPTAIRFPDWIHEEMGFAKPANDEAGWMPLKIINKGAMSKLLGFLTNEDWWNRVDDDVPF